MTMLKRLPSKIFQFTSTPLLFPLLQRLGITKMGYAASLFSVVPSIHFEETPVASMSLKPSKIISTFAAST